jgi:hypothetical protein
MATAHEIQSFISAEWINTSYIVGTTLHGTIAAIMEAKYPKQQNQRTATGGCHWQLFSIFTNLCDSEKGRADRQEYC